MLFLNLQKSIIKMRKFLLISLLISLSHFTHAEVAVPELNTRVTDLTNTLSAEQKSHIEKKLTSLEQTEGSQVAVLIIPTTSPESIEGFSLRVVDKWKLGRKEVDDGILLTIAKNDRKVRIEVGNGLEGAITDVSAGRIIREYITPEFRQGRFYEGILAGVGQIENLIKGESLPPPPSNKNENLNADGSSIPFMVVGSSFLVPFLVPMFGRITSTVLVTVAGSSFIWLTTYSLQTTFIAIIFLGIFGFAFSAPRSNSYRDGGGHGGGFGGGGFDGGFGGGSSSGGFSGGGGGFGGGGASGSW